MKKAKEYAAEYRANQSDETLGSIAAQFLVEVTELAETRRVKTPAGHNAILDEQDRKWRAFARYFEDIINPTGFEDLIRAKFPLIYACWRGPLRKEALRG